MAHILIMPRQGNTVESCIITNWKVKEGDRVTAETTVCEVETDKAAFDVPAGADGIVLKILRGAGDDVPVLEPIAVIGEAGENWQAVTGNEKGTGNKETVPAKSVPDSVPQPTVPSPQPIVQSAVPISPRARNLAEKEALPLSVVSGTGPGGRIIERDVAAALENRPGLTAAAKAAGPGTLPDAGSGIGGRVTVADLAAGPDAAAPVRSPFSSEGAVTETPIKGIRKVISDRMFKSLAESAQFTLNASASASKLQEFRSTLKKRAELAEKLGLSKITVNDLVLFAVSRTLPRFPFMNAHKLGDTIKTFERVHLGTCGGYAPRPYGSCYPQRQSAFAGADFRRGKAAGFCLPEQRRQTGRAFGFHFYGYQFGQSGHYRFYAGTQRARSRHSWGLRHRDEAHGPFPGGGE